MSLRLASVKIRLLAGVAMLLASLSGTAIPPARAVPTLTGVGVSGDFNADGKTDVANFSSGSWVVGLSTGSRFNHSEWGSLPPGNWAHVVGDYNQDGKDDIASFLNGEIRVAVSNGSTFTVTQWARSEITSGWANVFGGDFDGNGRQDLATYNTSNGQWYVWRTSGGETFTMASWSPSVSPLTGWVWVTGEFTDDGVDDIAGYAQKNGTWWVGRSDREKFIIGKWETNSTYFKGWSRWRVGDFNGDSVDDVAGFRSDTGTWWVYRSSRTAFANAAVWTDYSTTVGWTAALVGNFDRFEASTSNGDDIADFHVNSAAWWTSTSKGSSFSHTRWSDLEEGGWSETAVVGDFDDPGDSAEDVAIFNEASGRWWVGLAAHGVFNFADWSTTPPAPSISEVAPAEGPVGTSVSIFGHNFSGASQVRFGQTPTSDFVVESDDQVSATVPEGATSGRVTVTTPGGTALSPTTFVVTETQATKPRISGFSPMSGYVGTAVTIRGQNLGGTLSVEFGKVPSKNFSVKSGKSLLAVVPKQAENGPIRVTTSSGHAQSAAAFGIKTPSPDRLHRREISIQIRSGRGQYLRISGRVRARPSYRGCTAHVPVTVQLLTNGEWNDIATFQDWRPATRSGGRYKVKVPNNPGTFRTRVTRDIVHRHTCLSAYSKGQVV